VSTTTKKRLYRPSSRGLLPTNLPLFSCLLQLPISLSMDLLLTPGEIPGVGQVRTPSARDLDVVLGMTAQRVVFHYGFAQTSLGGHVG
jgi:hypothetical protein